MPDPQARADAIAEIIDDQAIPTDDDLAFSTPWQARLVGMILALRQQPEIDWDDLKQRLVNAIADADQAALQDDVEAVYYGRWLECLEEFLIDRDFSSVEEIHHRQEEFEAGDRDESEFVLRDDPLTPRSHDRG